MAFTQLLRPVLEKKSRIDTVLLTIVGRGHASISLDIGDYSLRVILKL